MVDYLQLRQLSDSWQKFLFTCRINIQFGFGHKVFGFYLELEFAGPKFSHVSINSLGIFFVIGTVISRYLTIGEMFQDVRCISPEALVSLY